MLYYGDMLYPCCGMQLWPPPKREGRTKKITAGRRTIIRALEASRKIAWCKVNIQLLVPPTFLRLTRGII
jgi:hypothetical protein